MNLHPQSALHEQNKTAGGWRLVADCRPRGLSSRGDPLRKNIKIILSRCLRKPPLVAPYLHATNSRISLLFSLFEDTGHDVSPQHWYCSSSAPMAWVAIIFALWGSSAAQPNDHQRAPTDVVAPLHENHSVFLFLFLFRPMYKPSVSVSNALGKRFPDSTSTALFLFLEGLLLQETHGREVTDITGI